MHNIRKFKTRRLVQSIVSERKKLVEGPEVEKQRIAKQVAKRKAAKQQVKEVAAEQRKKRKRELEIYEERKEQKKLKREVRDIKSFIEPEQQNDASTSIGNDPSTLHNELGVQPLTDEEKKQKMEEELKKLQEEEEKKKKEQLAKYLQRVSPSSVFKRVSTEQAAKKEASKYFFSSLPVPLLIKKGANAIFPQMTPLQHLVIHSCLSGKDDLRVTRPFAQASERVVSYMLPILSKLVQTNHQQNLAAIVLVPTVEAAKEVFAVAAQLLKFNAISTPPFVKIFTQRFKQAKTFLRTGHCHVLITVPQVLLWHLRTSKFSKSQFSHLVFDSAEAFEKLDLIKQIMPDLPSERTTLVFANELSENVAKIANFVCKPNHVKIKEEKQEEKVVEEEN